MAAVARSFRLWTGSVRAAAIRDDGRRESRSWYPEAAQGGKGLSTSIVEAFLACDVAVQWGILVHRTSREDKEFHFQNWFRSRLDSIGIAYDPPARNAYPDFRLVAFTEGFEIKGLAYPGREASYDSNSQVPTGFHNGRTIYYLFGRYPSAPDADDYPVIDFVLCHGDFLNADHTYIHRNKSIRGFGSYGDLMIRDRKMYVAPTPFALTKGTTGQRTLILPADHETDQRLQPVGELTRTECPRLVTGYSFDLRTNSLLPEYTDNPSAGAMHRFVAFRVRGGATSEVSMSSSIPEVHGEELE